MDCVQFLLSGGRAMQWQVMMMGVVGLVLAGCGGSSPGSQPLPLGLSPTSIVVDPNNVTPLAAELTFTAPEAGVLSITVKGQGAGGIDISHEFAGQASTFRVPVLGLYADALNTVVVELTGGSGQRYRDELTVATQPLPGMLDISIIADDLPADDQSVFLFSRQRAAFDRNGDIRWAYLGDVLDIFRKLPNGSLLLDSAINQINYHSPKFIELSMLGVEEREYIVPDYLHHEVRLLPWGNYLVAGNSSLIDFATNGVPEEDILVELDKDTGLVVKTWDFNLILDPSRTPLPTNPRADDWLHLNSAIYLPDDNSIVITGQRQSIAAKIDYDTSELIWILGAHEGWPATLQDKLLTPVDAQGTPLDISGIDFWPYGPHAVVVRESGAVALFDNGAYRGWFKDSSASAASYSRGIEYAVDEDNMTVSIAWTYDAEESLFTAVTGDMDYFADADTYLVGFAAASAATPRVVEVNRGGEVRFEAVSGQGNLSYRVEKFDLYDGL